MPLTENLEVGFVSATPRFPLASIVITTELFTLHSYCGPPNDVPTPGVPIIVLSTVSQDPTLNTCLPPPCNQSSSE